MTGKDVRLISCKVLVLVLGVFFARILGVLCYLHLLIPRRHLHRTGVLFISV